MLELVLLLFEAPQPRARDGGNRDAAWGDDHGRGLTVFGTCLDGPERLAQPLLDEAPDEVAHGHAVQGRAGLERSVEMVRKVDGSSHVSIFAYLHTHGNAAARQRGPETSREVLMSSSAPRLDARSVGE
jgi:hypothetical protein